MVVGFTTYITTQDFQKQADREARFGDTAGVSRDTLRMATDRSDKEMRSLWKSGTRSSYKGHTVDALVPEGDEGRSELR